MSESSEVPFGGFLSILREALESDEVHVHRELRLDLESGELEEIVPEGPEADLAKS